MSHEGPSSTAILSYLWKVLGLSREEAEGGTFPAEALLRRTRQQLLECARYLRVTGVHRLTKSALVERLQEALQGLGYPSSPEPDEPLDTAHRFAVARPADETAPVEHIPWGYGQDRVTAMAVDPENLYVYWEVTDAAIERARGDLGAAGPDAGPALRIYDVTNRIFDGTNAHGFFDQRLERTDRQWFFFIGKPTSTAIVELGLVSADGSFARIARSGRVDFPRREPAAGGPVEWLTVHAQTGEVGDPTPGAAPPAIAAAPASPSDEPVHRWDIRFTHGTGGERQPLDEAQWEEWLRTIEWHGPLVEMSWDAGPFPFPVEAVRCVEERYAGGVSVQSIGGTTRVVYGPWQVIIRGLGARAERRVLAVWEIRRAWASRRSAAGETLLASGSSEELALGASEMRLGGASEIYRLGASEFRYGGASEILYAGASERRLGGASERLYAGASEHAGRRRE